MQASNTNKLPFLGFGSTNGRDTNHNDKSSPSFYNKDSSIAALEAFQREYLPAVTSYPGNIGTGTAAPGLISQRVPSTISSSRAGSPPSPLSLNNSPRSFDHFNQPGSHSFDEQFKDVS